MRGALPSSRARTAAPGTHTLTPGAPGGGAWNLRHQEGGAVADVINPALANMEGGESAVPVAGRGASGSTAVAATVRELLQDGKESGRGPACVSPPCAEAEDPSRRFAQSFLSGRGHSPPPGPPASGIGLALRFPGVSAGHQVLIAPA